MANSGLSATKRKSLDEELRAAITAQVSSRILPKLPERFEAVVGKSGWKLTTSNEPNEEMTLLFHYPPAFEYQDYLRPQIKIEFGRGDQQPRKNIPSRLSWRRNSRIS